MNPQIGILGQDALVTYLLVLFRCGAMFSVLPVFSVKQIPQQVKLALAVGTAFLLTATMPKIAAPTQIMDLAIMLISQIFLGLIVGFGSTLVFAAIQYAGEIIDTQVGFAVTNIINPLSGTSVTILGQFELIMATIIFLLTNSHHLLLQGMAGSFAIVPLPYINPRPEAMQDLLQFFGMTLLIVIKIAAPVAIALMITNIAMGLLSRIAPQVNVFLVAFPAQLGIGMLIFALSLPVLGYILPAAFARIPVEMDHMLRHMSTRG